jgi:hypothetical protein
MYATLVIICDKDRPVSKLQKLFAKDEYGATCDEMPFHAGLLVRKSMHGKPTLYHMMRTLERCDWETSSYKKDYREFELPCKVHEGFMDAMVGNINYGYLDFMLYPLMKLLNLNLPGKHCTEYVNDVLWWHTMRTNWNPLKRPPTPCELLTFCKTSFRAIPH